MKIQAEMRNYKEQLSIFRNTQITLLYMKNKFIKIKHTMNKQEIGDNRYEF